MTELIDPVVSSAIARAIATLFPSEAPQPLPLPPPVMEPPAIQPPVIQLPVMESPAIERLPLMPPMKRRRILTTWEVHLGLELVPRLTPHTRQTALHLIYLFKEIEHTELPKSTRLRRIIELLYYILARPVILHERLSFTHALMKQLYEWIHIADKEMAILGVMNSLCIGVMHKELQVQLGEVSYYEHIRECAVRLIVVAKDLLAEVSEAAKARSIAQAITALSDVAEPGT